MINQYEVITVALTTLRAYAMRYSHIISFTLPLLQLGVSFNVNNMSKVTVHHSLATSVAPIINYLQVHHKVELPLCGYGPGLVLC